MDQLELLPEDAIAEFDDFDVFDGLDPMLFLFASSPADVPGFVDGPLPDDPLSDDPAEGARQAAGYAAGYAARSSECLDVVAADHRLLAMRAAHQARSIDTARLWSQISDEFVLGNPLMSVNQPDGAPRHEPDSPPF